MGRSIPDDNYSSDTADYAKQLRNEAHRLRVAFHPYAKKKARITHDFGARRGTRSGRGLLAAIKTASSS